MPDSGWSRRLRRLLASIAALTLLAALLVASLLAFEFRFTMDGQRERIARAVSDALGVPVAIAGPVELRTGPRAGLEVGRVRMGSAESPGGWMLDATRLWGRVQTLALLRQDIRIVDVIAEDAVVCVRAAREPPPAKVQAPRAPSWTLTEVGRLELRQVSVVVDPSCDPGRRLAELQSLELRGPRGAPVTASGRAIVAGVPTGVEAQGPTLAAFTGRLDDQPFELSARFAEATARASGRVDLGRLAFDAELVFDAPEFVTLLQAFGAPFKAFGPLSARAQVAGHRGGLEVRVDELSFVPVTARAEAALDWSGPRPLVAVDATTARLDLPALREWLDRSIDVAKVHPGRLRNLAIAALRTSDGRFALGMERLEAGAISLSGVSWDGQWRQGEVTSNAQAEGWSSARSAPSRSPIEAVVNADLRGDEPVVTATARMQDFALPAGPVTGVVGTLDLEYVARAVPGQDATLGSRAVVVARSAKLAVAPDKRTPVALTIDRARVEWRQGQSLVGDAAGTWSGTRARATLNGADIGALWQGRPWALSARGEIAALRIASKGTLALRGGHLDADLGVDLQADRLDDRLPAGLAGLPLNAQGDFGLRAGRWRVDLRRLQLGRTDARGWVAGRLPTSEPFQGEVQFGTLDLVQLAARPSGARPGGFVLPRQLALPAADLALGATRVALPGTVAANARLEARVRDGRLDQAPFAFELDGAAVRGALSLDLSGASAALGLRAEASGIDEGHLGGALEESGLGFRIGSLNVAASSTGNEPGELAAHARLELALQRAAVTMAPRGRAPALSAEISAATMSAAPGQPTRLAVDGDLEGLPTRIEASLPGLAALRGSADAVFRASGRLDRIDVEVAGAWPGSAPQDRPLRVSVAAPTLTAFDRVLGQDLPDTAPFRLEADLLATGSDRPSANVRMALGESRVDAHLERLPEGDRPRWDLDVASPRLRLEDLGSAAWIDGPGRVRHAAPIAPSASPEAMDQARARLRGIGEELRPALQRFDARARVAVDRITSGEDNFGALAAEARLDAGRLQIAPLSLAGPHGDLHVAGTADLSTETVPFELDVGLSRFEYGRLVQTLDPKRDGEGELSLRVQLKGVGNVEDALRGLDGRVGVLVLPRKSGDVRLLDRWGGGLLANLGLALDPEQSRLNCGVAAFEVSHGAAKSKALMLDTTRVRAAGDLEVDLTNGQLKGMFASRAKRPELFSARLPVIVGGTLEAPKVAPAAGSLVVTAARYVFFAYAFLFDTVGGTTYPPDGTPDCVATYGRLPE